MTSFFFTVPGEVLTAAQQAAFAVHGVQPVEAVLPPAAPAGQVYVLGSPQAVQVNGAWQQNWVLATLAAPTLIQQAEAALATGVFSIASASTPALNGSYFCTAASRSNVLAEVVSILNGGVFTDGTTTRLWQDASGAAHSFSVAAFKSFSVAMGFWIDALENIVDTGTGAIPSQPSSIP
jgi:hypothetical protein